MSIESDANTVSTSLQVYLDRSLPDSEQETILAYLRLLPRVCIESNLSGNPIIIIKGMVDGRGLACPMPLLKTKVALRNMDNGDSIYVIATDPNSQADLIAFCQQAQQLSNAASLQLTLNQSSNDISDQCPIATSSHSKFDTIFHFIITKTDSN